MVASKLIGANVTNAANDTIGQIADFVLDQKGSVKAWIIGRRRLPGDRLEVRGRRPVGDEARPDRRQDAPGPHRHDKDQLKAAPEYIYLGKEPPKGAAAAPARRRARRQALTFKP